MSEKLKYMSIYLQKNVEVNEWSAVRNGMYRTSIHCEPELKDKEDWIEHDTNCVFFHRKLEFTLDLSLDKDSTHMEAGILYKSSNQDDVMCFVEQYNIMDDLGKTRQEEFKHVCNASRSDDQDYSNEDIMYWNQYPPSEKGLCRDYNWALDKCIVKMTFMNKNKDKSLTKRLNLDFAHEISKSKECTNFKEPMFISKKELKSSLDFKLRKSAKGGTFLPVNIEVSARIYLEGWISGSAGSGVKRSAAEDDQECLITPPSVALTASNKRMKLSTFEYSHHQSPLRPDDENCDLILEIGPDGENCISVHKAVLAVKSTVFFTMFFGGWKDIKSGNLKLEESNLAVATAFVRYLYDSNANIGPLDRFDWDVKVSFDVLKLAHLYQIMDLVEYCVDNIFLAPNSDLSLTTALEILKYGQLLDIQDLSTRSLQWIKSNKEGFDSEDKAKLDDFIASSDDTENIFSSIE